MPILWNCLTIRLYLISSDTEYPKPENTFNTRLKLQNWKSFNLWTRLQIPIVSSNYVDSKRSPWYATFQCVKRNQFIDSQPYDEIIYVDRSVLLDISMMIVANSFFFCRIWNRCSIRLSHNNLTNAYSWNLFFFVANVVIGRIVCFGPKKQFN